MIQHQQDEKVISGYNPQIIRRLAAFAAPYKWFLFFAFVALVIGTVGEMLIPVMIQRTLDHEILDHRVRIHRSELDRFPRADEVTSIGGWRYIREEQLDQISQSTRRDLIARGHIDPARYLIVDESTVSGDADLARIVGDSIVATDGDSIVIPVSIQDELSPKQRLILREESVRGIRRNTGIFLVVLFGALAGSFGQVYLTAYTGQLVMKRLRLRLFHHTIHQSLAFLGNQAVGRLVTRVTNDVETINEFFSSVLAQMARNVSLMIAVVITMYSLNPRLATIIVATMIPVIAITELFRRRALTAYRRVRHAVSAVNAYLSEYISGMSVVQLFVQQRRSRRDFVSRAETLLSAHLGEMYVFAVFRPVVDFLATLSTAFVIFFGARLLGMELVSIGVLIAFTNLIRRFYMPLMNISEQFTILQSAMAGSERVFSLLDEDHRIPDSGTRSIDRRTFSGRITFDHVVFSYKENEPVIRDLSLGVSPGEMVAIVGYTGAGKTTIINLVTRLWDVDSGAIKLDDVDIRKIPLRELRGTIQQIQQDVFLFDETIRNNLTLGLDVSDDQIWEACETVQIADYIRGLEEGLDTRLHERGTNLSAGQRQLLAFARVLLHDPPVLILDEATSSIDSETEHKLQHAVEAVTGGRTSLVVAHRLSTIQDADRIVVMSHGRIAEVGDHATLLAAGGLYATLYRLQYAQRDSFHD
ncbi:MAG: ABC transporter ATP-binding protein [Alkalispirochaeta sp.]